jgi:DNA topoisomerase VI subunit A
MSIENRTMLLRDVYYTKKSSFKSQEECNSVIFEIGKILQLKRCKTALFSFFLSFSLFLLPDER